MYVLQNTIGNVVRHTDSVHKRDELLRQGYVEIKPKSLAKAKKAKPSNEKGRK